MWRCERHLLHLMDIVRSLPTEAWKHCSWTTAGGQRHSTRIAWQEVFLARGLKEPYGQLVSLARGQVDMVQELKTRIAATDGLLIATPEYKNSIPGVLKSAFDWLSRPPEDNAS
jgi:NAD(P)H-dependent FMN reductase